MSEFYKYGGRGDRSGRGKGNMRNEERDDSRKYNDRGPKVMYDATCTNCGNQCQVPFKPSGDKPVLCDNCFSKKREDSNREYKSSNQNRERNSSHSTVESNENRSEQKINDLKIQVIALTEKVQDLTNITNNLSAKIATMEVVKTVMPKPEKKVKEKKSVKKD